MNRVILMATAAGFVLATWFGGWAIYDVLDLWNQWTALTYQNVLGFFLGLEVLGVAAASYRVHDNISTKSEPRNQEERPQKADSVSSRVQERLEMLATRVDKLESDLEDYKIADRLAPEKKDKRPGASEKLPETLVQEAT